MCFALSDACAHAHWRCAALSLAAGVREQVKKILEKGRAPIKELLAHLRKEQESGKKKKKAK
eukprot:105662-Rhodomonas_salina.1